MILLLVTMVLLIGSVAAADTSSNSTIAKKSLQKTTQTTSTQSTTTKTQTNKKTSSATINNTQSNQAAGGSTTVNSNSTERQSTKTIVYGATASPNSNVTFKTLTTTNNGNNASIGTVVYKINSKTIGSSKVTNGVSSFNYTIPSSWTNIKYTITAVYNNNTNYASSTSSNTLKIKSNLPTVITVSNITAETGSQSTLSAILTTSDGKYVKTGKVAFKINGKTIGYATVSNGGAKYTYTIPSDWKTKSYTIQVLYGTNDYYSGARGTGTLKVKYKVNSEVTINTDSANTGQSTLLIATIKDSSGNSISGGKVVFKINGKSIGTVTVSNGKAQLTYTIPSNWSAKKYNISVIYGGHGIYRSARNTSTIKISSSKSSSSSSTTSSSSVSSAYASYLKATNNCQVNNAKIISMAKKLTSGVSSVYDKAVKIFNYVRSSVYYTYYYNTRYGAVGTLSRGYGNCVDQTHLLVALMRASNIPARYCHSTCYFRSGLVVGHVWGEVNVNGKWYSCDTTSTSNSFNKIVNWNRCTSINRYTSLSF